MSINNNTGYVTIQIPDTRFKISYKPIDFDIIDFLDVAKILTDSELFELMEDSFKYDNKKLEYYEYLDISQFFNNDNFIPKLRYIYQLINSEQQFLRDNASNIKVQDQNDYIYIKHKGINSKELNEKELQNLVNYYYNYQDKLPFYMGYIFYMFYERLHPNPNYNGVLGRLFFVQNYSFRNFFPISTFLCNIKCQYVEDIYELFNFSQKIQIQSNTTISNSQNLSKQSKKDILSSEPDDSEKYFSITLDKEAVSKIILILLFSIIYYQSHDYNEDIEELLKEYFKDPFKRNPKFGFIYMANFIYIRERINELNWNQNDSNRFYL